MASSMRSQMLAGSTPWLSRMSSMPERLLASTCSNAAKSVGGMSSTAPGPAMLAYSAESDSADDAVNSRLYLPY